MHGQNHIKHTDSLSTLLIAANCKYYHQCAKYKCIENKYLPNAFMSSSKFSLDASLYFLFNARVILNATPVNCQPYDGTTFYADCVVTGSVRALPVDDAGYSGTEGRE